MTAGRFQIPNWSHELIAQAVGLDPTACMVRMEDESKIVFLISKTQEEYCVDKKTGEQVNVSVRRSYDH